MPRGNYEPRYSDEVRIGACADFLLGKSWYVIQCDWKVSKTTVLKWIKRTGSFKAQKGIELRSKTNDHTS